MSSQSFWMVSCFSFEFFFPISAAATEAAVAAAAAVAAVKA